MSLRPPFSYVTDTILGLAFYYSTLNYLRQRLITIGANFQGQKNIYCKWVRG